MKRPVVIALVGAVLIWLSWGTVEPGSPRGQVLLPPSDPAPAPPEPTREPTELTVLSAVGTEVTLTIDENTEVLVVATWCPWTKRVDRALQDPRVRPLIKEKRLVYLLRWDEADRRIGGWVEDGRWPQEAADAALATLPAHLPRLMDPDFLGTVAAREIYYYDDAHPLEIRGYPSAYSGPPNRFRQGSRSWMTGRVGIPPAIKDEFMGEGPGMSMYRY